MYSSRTRCSPWHADMCSDLGRCLSTIHHAALVRTVLRPCPGRVVCTHHCCRLLAMFVAIDLTTAPLIVMVCHMQAVELFLSMQMAHIEPSRQVLLALFDVFEASNRPGSAAHLLTSCQVCCAELLA